ncbi:MAG: SGNH/GDSL hydrolase family protein [Pseudonocardiaceae bacterium]|nr:SGNH/GDSL hydrolase family protein [Pseudonocardiaceae bacterium]
MARGCHLAAARRGKPHRRRRARQRTGQRPGRGIQRHRAALCARRAHHGAHRGTARSAARLLATTRRHQQLPLDRAGQACGRFPVAADRLQRWHNRLLDVTEHPKLLVLGDSLSFHGPDGPHPADDPRLWPNVTARELGGSVELVAGFGWTARDAWWALIGDPRIWALLHQVDAVVFAVGSMDTLPSPLPTYLRLGLRYLRPRWLRRRARGMYLAAQPRLARLLRGHPAVLPTRLTVHYLDTAVGAVRILRPGLPVVGWRPAVHRAQSYGYVHTVRPKTERAIERWARRSDVPLVDVPSVTADHVFGGYGNPDGMHWGWEGHTLVGKAVAESLSRRLGAA